MSEHDSDPGEAPVSEPFPEPTSSGVETVDPLETVDPVETDVPDEETDRTEHVDQVAQVDVPETGHPAVDEVLASLADLDERPVSEHVAVFERAHDRLRAALADAGNSPA